MDRQEIVSKVRARILGGPPWSCKQGSTAGEDIHALSVRGSGESSAVAPPYPPGFRCLLQHLMVAHIYDPLEWREDNPPPKVFLGCPVVRRFGVIWMQSYMSVFAQVDTAMLEWSSRILQGGSRYSTAQL